MDSTVLSLKKNLVGAGEGGGDADNLVPRAPPSVHPEVRL